MPTPQPGRSILIIDDDVAVAKIFERVLSAGGFRVRVAGSADEALRELDQDRPDAIILDLRMPFIDGFGLLYRIRSRPALQHLPVLVITGKVTLSEDTLTELAALGAKVKYKPIEPAALLAEARALIGSI